MKIDLFNHFAPGALVDFLLRTEAGAAAVARWRNIPTLVDLDARFALMDEFGDYVQIPSLPNPPIEALGSPAESADVARVANDAMAELCARYPDRFPSFVASLPMNDIDAAVDEAARAVTALGAAGSLVYSNVLGQPLDRRPFRAVFDVHAALDHPVWIHPIRGPDRPDYPTESRSEHELWFTFGWPYETAAAMGRLVYSGLFDALPGIKLVTHHLGGLVPYLEGKIALGFRQAGEGDLDTNPVAVEAGLARPPVDYFRMFYGDTAVNGVARALDCGLGFFGPEHVVFASDAPFDPTGGAHLIRESIRLVDALDSEVRDRIYAGNARALIPSLSRHAGS